MPSPADVVLPAPLLSTEIDLRRLSYIPFHVEKLLASDTWLMANGDEAKALVTLICRSWHQKPAGSLPSDDRLLAALSGAGSKWPKVKELVLRGWVLCSDHRYYHPVICAEAIEAHQKRIKWREKKRKQRAGDDDVVSDDVSKESFDDSGGDIATDSSKTQPLRDGTVFDEKSLSASTTNSEFLTPSVEVTKVNCRPNLLPRRRGSIDYSRPDNRNAFADNKVHEVLAGQLGHEEAWGTIFSARDPKHAKHREARENCEQIARSIGVRWEAEI